MKRVVFFAAGLLLPTAVAAADYDCVLDGARSIRFDDEGKVTANPLRFPEESDKRWAFTLRHDEREAEIVWRNSPMQLSGKSALIPTSEGSYAGFYVGRGPCLFTETHCGTTLHFAEQRDGSLKIQLHPIALTSYEDGHREPFVVYLSGTCQAKDVSE
jgi:hypothetical protein